MKVRTAKMIDYLFCYPQIPRDIYACTASCLQYGSRILSSSRHTLLLQFCTHWNAAFILPNTDAQSLWMVLSWTGRLQQKLSYKNNFWRTKAVKSAKCYKVLGEEQVEMVTWYRGSLIVTCNFTGGQCHMEIGSISRLEQKNTCHCHSYIIMNIEALSSF